MGPQRTELRRPPFGGIDDALKTAEECMDIVMQRTNKKYDRRDPQFLVAYEELLTKTRDAIRVLSDAIETSSRGERLSDTEIAECNTRFANSDCIRPPWSDLWEPELLEAFDEVQHGRRQIASALFLQIAIMNKFGSLEISPARWTDLRLCLTQSEAIVAGMAASLDVHWTQVTPQ